jgi:uncharacterized membrane protein YhaH (DUF805 family)
MEWYLKVVRDNYANFNGRARRKEFWMFVLFNIIISWGLSLLDSMLGFSFQAEPVDVPGMEWISSYRSGGYLSSFYSLVVLIPSIAVGVRRLHDIGKSGWNILWGFFCCVGWIYLIYLYIQEGEKGQNEYGTDPKGGENNDPFAGQRDTDNPFVNK